MQGGPDTLPLDGYRKYWIAGLHEEIKSDVMMMALATFIAAVTRAQLRERVLNTIKRDKEKMESGKRPQPEEKKPSTDARPAEQMVKDIVGLG